MLSEADNWYVPSRLTPEMNRQLETTDIAFGRAVQALKFRRRTLSAELLWSPLPQGWEMGAALPDLGAGSLALPAQLLQHRAVLTLPDGTPFSEVVETYTSEVLAFPEPARQRLEAAAGSRPVSVQRREIGCISQFVILHCNQLPKTIR